MATHSATARRADGTEIYMRTDDDPEDWLQLGDVRGLQPPGFDTELEETTHYSTPKGQREYLAGRSAPQTISVNLAFTPSGETYAAIMAARGEKRGFRIEYSDGLEQTFDAIVQTWAPGDPGMGAWTGTLTLQVTGGITEVAP